MLAFLSSEPLIFPLLQVGVLAVASWKVLSGSRGAAVFLGVVLSLGVVLTLYQVVFTPNLPTIAVATLGIWAALPLATAAVIFFHAEVRGFYVARANAGWRGEL